MHFLLSRSSCLWYLLKFVGALTPDSNLFITIDNGEITAVPGTSQTYTITVTNNGPQDENCKRSYGSLDYMSPMEYELHHSQGKDLAA